MENKKKNSYELLTTSRFYVELKLRDSNELVDGYFMECQGLKRNIEVIEHCEVFSEPWGSKPAKTGRMVRSKIPGNSTSENIVLKQGLCISSTVWKWFRSIEQGQWAKQICDGDISIYNQAQSAGEAPSVRLRFFGAWPISYKLSDFKADGNDFQVEEMVLAVNDLIRVTPEGNEY